MMRSVELFAGAGGLALGAAQAGFRHEAVLEWNRDACATLRLNQSRGQEALRDCLIIQDDIRAVDFSAFGEGIDLLSGGPPCQPFSMGGKHRAHTDDRDMFPAAIAVVRQLRPRAVLFENVRGLARQAFAEYLQYIVLQLSNPEIVRCGKETWSEHRGRLEQYHTTGRHDGLHYRAVFRVLDAADYGVPQRRHRIFIVAFRSDLGAEWSFPTPTHSLDALLWDQYVTGDYWERHGVARRHLSAAPTGMRQRVAALRAQLRLPLALPWRTVRDALWGLPDPEGGDDGWLHHDFIPGARVYHGHTGSLLDEPAKVLKAGDHGCPGGENMVVLPNGRPRYLTVREAARVQTFPDDFEIAGSRTEKMRQLGNAVPVALGLAVATAVQQRLASTNATSETI
jgi:DNA (cytosine-5)-methyltransferase 1